MYKKDKDPILLICNKTNNKGKDPTKVYNNIYIPACNRSGCPPQKKIIKTIGINTISKKK